jgi:hypothetical protein
VNHPKVFDAKGRVLAEGKAVRVLGDWNATVMRFGQGLRGPTVEVGSGAAVRLCQTDFITGIGRCCPDLLLLITDKEKGDAR